MSDDERMSDNVSLSTGALLEPETPKNTGTRELRGVTGAGCLTMKENDEAADKTQGAAGTL